MIRMIDDNGKVQTLIIVVMDKVRCRHDALLMEKEVG